MVTTKCRVSFRWIAAEAALLDLERRFTATAVLQGEAERSGDQTHCDQGDHGRDGDGHEVLLEGGPCRPGYPITIGARIGAAAVDARRNRCRWSGSPSGSTGRRRRKIWVPMVEAPARPPR